MMVCQCGGWMTVCQCGGWMTVCQYGWMMVSVRLDDGVSAAG